MYYKTCSNKCAGTLARKVDWDSIDVNELLSSYRNAEQVGNFLGISGAAVRKRIKKVDGEMKVHRLTF